MKYHGIAAASLISALAACSGGGSGTIASSPAHTAGQNPGGSSTNAIVKQRLSFFIPASATASSARTRSYVSSASKGVGVVTSQSGTQLDSVSLNLSGGSACTATTNNGVAGQECSVSVGVAAPSSTITIAVYDQSPTGPAATDFPAGSNVLSTTSQTVAITSGTANAITLGLGAVIHSFSLTNTATSAPLINDSIFSLGGQRYAPMTFNYSYSATDADGKTITAGSANDPLATPVTFTVTEPSGLTGHTLLTLRTLQSNGQYASGTPSASVTSSSTTDNITISYDGAAPALVAGKPSGYNAAINVSTAPFSDPITGSTTPASKTSFTFAPIFAAASDSVAGDGFSVTGAGAGAPFPVINVPANGNITFATSQAPSVSNQANVPSDPQPGVAKDLDAGGSACTAFTIAQTGANSANGYNYSLTVDGSNPGAICQFGFSDGTSAGQTLTFTELTTTGTGTTGPTKNSGTVIFAPVASPETIYCPANGGNANFQCDGQDNTGQLDVTLKNTSDAFSVSCDAASQLPCTTSNGTAVCADTAGEAGISFSSSGPTSNAFFEYAASDATSPAFQCTFDFLDTTTNTTYAYVVNVAQPTATSARARRVTTTRRNLFAPAQGV